MRIAPVVLGALALCPSALGGSLAPTLSAIAGVPVVCYSTMHAYTEDSGLPAADPGAGFWGVSIRASAKVIGLTPGVCADLAHARAGWSGNGVSHAVFVLSHEIAHAQGLDYAYMAAHADDATFAAQGLAIASAHNLDIAAAQREAAADCVGLERVSQVAYQLGMRGHTAFGYLARFARLDGYVRIPRQCWQPEGSTIQP